MAQESTLKTLITLGFCSSLGTLLLVTPAWVTFVGLGLAVLAVTIYNRRAA